MGLINVPGRRVDPNYTPGFPVEVDPSHPLAEGLVAFIAILDDPVPDYDLLGNPITWTKSWATVDMVSEPTEFGPVQKNIGTSSRAYGVEAAIPVDSSLLDVGDITCLCDVDIGYLGTDVGLITLNNLAWSWLDTSGGVLRTSAYTTYDTTNPINSTGSKKIGLIWRKDNTYQTIAEGRFSQSGSATRQSITGGYAKTSRGAAVNTLWQSGTDGNTATPRWWGLWSRSLSEDECFSIFNAPFQILKPLGAKRIWVPVSAGSPTYTLTAATGSFTTTGVSASLLVSRKLTAGTGGYTTTGIAAGLIAARKLTAGIGSFTTTGVSAGLIAARKIAAGVGSFTTTGYAADLVYTPTGGSTYTLTAGVGTFTTTYVAAGLKASRKLIAGTGAFTTTGYAAGISKTYLLTAGLGSFTTTGVAASLIANRVLTAGTGAFTTTGYPATLTTATAPSLSAADLEAIWDVELETGYTARQMMRIMFAALAGKRSGLGTSTESYYDVATGSTVRISLTPDQNGNGTPVVDGT